MKKFFKIAALVLAVVMVFSFVGCTKTDDGNETTEPAEKVTNEDAGKVYTIASDNAFAPFEFYDTATSQYIGIDMDILAAVAADQGFKYKIDNVGFDAALSAVQTGSADGVIAGMTINDERKLTFDFSDGYFDAGQILVVPANSDIDSLEDLRGTTVAAKASTQGAEFAQANAEQYGFEVQVYEDSPTMYQGVLQGNNSACFEDEPVVLYAIKSNSLALKTVGEVFNAKPYGFGVKLGTNPELIKMFNDGLANIKANGTYNEILAKYGY